MPPIKIHIVLFCAAHTTAPSGAVLHHRHCSRNVQSKCIFPLCHWQLYPIVVKSSSRQVDVRSCCVKDKSEEKKNFSEKNRSQSFWIPKIIWIGTICTVLQGTLQPQLCKTFVFLRNSAKKVRGHSTIKSHHTQLGQNFLDSC